MEETNKVYVFDRKEIFLVFIFMVILSVTCFTLGIRLGKNLSLQSAGVTATDVATVQMKSEQEEDVDKKLSEPEISDEEKLGKLMDESKEKLNTELDQVAKVEETAKDTTTNTNSTEVASAGTYAGKYTIQLGSYNTIDEAKAFSEGFTVRGYNPIINEVIIANKGTWYRVSLGLFDTVEDAKKYIKKEETLFQGQDYIISEMK